MTEKAPALVCIDGPEEDSFPVDITVTNLKGVKSTITFDCIPRTVSEWASEGDKIRAESRARLKAEEAKNAKKKPKKDGAHDEAYSDDDPVRVEAVVNDRINIDAKIALVIAKGWSVTDKYSAQALSKLENKFPGAISALLNEYSKRINGEREGN